jgi:hypothetical protein
MSSALLAKRFGWRTFMPNDATEPDCAVVFAFGHLQLFHTPGADPVLAMGDGFPAETIALSDEARIGLVQALPRRGPNALRATMDPGEAEHVAEIEATLATVDAALARAEAR